MYHCAESILKVDYFREYEFIFETALAHESVDPGVLFDEKNQRSKISCNCHFNKNCIPRKKTICKVRKTAIKSTVQSMCPSSLALDTNFLL
jgi:hypothetical protein